ERPRGRRDRRRKSGWRDAGRLLDNAPGLGRQPRAAGDDRARAFAAVRLPERACLAWYVERTDSKGWGDGRNRRYYQDSLGGREGQTRSHGQELGRIQAPVGEIWGPGRGEWVQRKSCLARWAAMDQRLGR